jgi:hypothetical protein
VASGQKRRDAALSRQLLFLLATDHWPLATAS